MSIQTRESLIVTTELSQEPTIARALWGLEDARARTMRQLAGLPEAAVDWLPPDGESSIGSVLYHIALIETDWLCAEVLEQPYPADLQARFPHPDRTADGRLTQVLGISYADHLATLAKVRARLLAVCQAMDLADYRRPRRLPGYDVTPEWVLHHLMQHEAEHRSQIGSLRNRAERALAGQTDA